MNQLFHVLLVVHATLLMIIGAGVNNGTQLNFACGQIAARMCE